MTRSLESDEPETALNHVTASSAKQYQEEARPQGA